MAEQLNESAIGAASSWRTGDPRDGAAGFAMDLESARMLTQSSRQVIEAARTVAAFAAMPAVAAASIAASEFASVTGVAEWAARSSRLVNSASYANHAPFLVDRWTESVFASAGAVGAVVASNASLAMLGGVSRAAMAPSLQQLVGSPFLESVAVARSMALQAGLMGQNVGVASGFARLQAVIDRARIHGKDVAEPILFTVMPPGDLYVQFRDSEWDRSRPRRQRRGTGSPDHPRGRTTTPWVRV